MSSVPSPVRVLIAVVATSIALVGCTGGEQTPTGYGDVNSEGDGYYGNFMYGCTGVEPTDGKYEGATLESPEFCTCVFEGLKETVNFDEMKEFEDAQADAPEGTEITLPANINAVREDCAPEAAG